VKGQVVPVTTEAGGHMNRGSRVLAGVDFSKAAREAFDYAIALSSRYSAELVAVHAVPPDRPFSWRARGRMVLMERFRQKATDARVEFTERIQSGPAADVILLHARSLRPDVIVMGTNQRTGMERLRVGSVAERVATKATVPVLLVPERRRIATTQPFRHVAVAVDFSPSSDRAVDQALTLATGPGDRITLIHVVHGFSSAVRPYLHEYGVIPYQDERIRDARQRLRSIAALVRRTSPHLVETRVLAGDTAAEIGRMVDTIGADVLVAGVPKRGAVSRALFGTTAARLLRTVRVPLMVVPDTGTVVTSLGGGPETRLAA
jgi:nucleotide-binding universal stress UspA family protein